MFALSVLTFIGQLYLLPEQFVDECRATSLKFMKGPRFWLHGKKGHAFFRAGREIGFQASPKCAETCGFQICYCTTLKHIPDFETKLSKLSVAHADGSCSLRQGTQVINQSPYACCRIVHAKSVKIELVKALRLVSTVNNTNKMIYDCFFDSIYKRNATLIKLEQVYRDRWCKTQIMNFPRPAVLAQSAGRVLRWLARRVPPKVHTANVRLHFNAFHTGRRYQRRLHTHCRFCNNEKAENSIEHIIHCRAVQQLFPDSMKYGNPPRVPVWSFFLFKLDTKDRIIFALIVYAIYTVHNDFRNSNDHSDFRKCVFRVLADVKLQPAQNKILWEVLAWRCHPLREGPNSIS